MSSTSPPIRWASSVIRRIASSTCSRRGSAPCWYSSALARSEASGVRSSWLASAKNRRVASWLASRSATKSSMRASIPFSAAPSRPISVPGSCGLTRSVRSPALILSACAGHHLDRPQAAAHHPGDATGRDRPGGRRPDDQDQLELADGPLHAGQAGGGVHQAVPGEGHRHQPDLGGPVLAGQGHRRMAPGQRLKIRDGNPGQQLVPPMIERVGLLWFTVTTSNCPSAPGRMARGPVICSWACADFPGRHEVAGM